jgi:hypothetical protein
MKKQDNLRAYMKELKLEEPSTDFTRLVMERVRVEIVKSPAVYQPLINKQVWTKIFIGCILFSIGAVLLRSYFPGNDNPALIPSFYQIDFTFILKPFQLLSKAMSGISLNYAGGAAAISMLLIADQFYTRMTDRRI